MAKQRTVQASKSRDFAGKPKSQQAQNRKKNVKHEKRTQTKFGTQGSIAKILSGFDDEDWGD